jgi:hypothetical protein
MVCGDAQMNNGWMNTGEPTESAGSAEFKVG